MLRKVLIPTISILILISCTNEENGSSSLDNTTETEERKPADQSNFDEYVDQLMVDISDRDLERLSETMLYLGGDENRNFNDTYHMDNPTDKKILSATADVLHNWIVNSDKYSIGITGDMNDQWGEWKVQEIILIKDRQIQRKYFSYLKKDNKWYLVKMENENPLEYQPS
ncbi:MAG: hypothetical protein HKN92_06815 [Chitinophagales bacterium]|nr:hypothetical protein [Chitinophagales bacterium]